MAKHIYFVTPVMLALLFAALPMPSFAQAPAAEAAPAPEKTLSPNEIAAAAQIAQQAAIEAEKAAAEKKAAEIAALPPYRKSLLFTDLEVDTILKASAGRAVQSTVGIESIELIPIDRKIWVSGIYYKSPQTWILWMNGYKLTPGYLLPEIRGIKVYQDRVELEWYDIGKNGIINITMQPHQVYDIVTGILVWDTDGGAPGGMGARR